MITTAIRMNSCSDVDNAILCNKETFTSDDGKIVISERLKGKNIHRFSINEETRINVSKGMIKYLRRHRRTLESLSNA